jgi:hypothetical protein
MHSWASYFQKVTSVEWVQISAEIYPLPFILGVISASRKKKSVEIYALPKKSVEITMAKFPH